MTIEIHHFIGTCPRTTDSRPSRPRKRTLLFN